MVRLTDRPDMTLDVYRGRKTTIQPTKKIKLIKVEQSARSGVIKGINFRFSIA